MKVIYSIEFASIFVFVSIRNFKATPDRSNDYAKIVKLATEETND